MDADHDDEGLVRVQVLQRRKSSSRISARLNFPVEVNHRYLIELDSAGLILSLSPFLHLLIHQLSLSLSVSLSLSHTHTGLLAEQI